MPKNKTTRRPRPQLRPAFCLHVGMTIRLRPDMTEGTADFLYKQAPGAVAVVEALRPNTMGIPYWATLRFADGSTGGTDIANIVDAISAYTNFDKISDAP